MIGKGKRRAADRKKVSVTWTAQASRHSPVRPSLIQSKALTLLHPKRGEKAAGEERLVHEVEGKKPPPQHERAGEAASAGAEATASYPEAPAKEMREGGQPH